MGKLPKSFQDITQSDCKTDDIDHKKSRSESLGIHAVRAMGTDMAKNDNRKRNLTIGRNKKVLVTAETRPTTPTDKFVIDSNGLNTIWVKIKIRMNMM